MPRQRKNRKSVGLYAGPIPRTLPQIRGCDHATADGSVARHSRLRCARDTACLFLQLPLEDFNLLSQRHVIADEALDFAHRM